MANLRSSLNMVVLVPEVDFCLAMCQPICIDQLAQHLIEHCSGHMMDASWHLVEMTIKPLYGVLV